MKKDQRKRLKAAAKRRSRRPSAAPAVTEVAATPVRTANVEVIGAVLTAAADSDLRINNQVILRSCRAFLKFSTPQDAAAQWLSQRFADLVESKTHPERDVRDAVSELADQAAQHCGDDDSRSDSLVAFLRTLNA